MDKRKVLIVGDSAYAQGLAQSLADSDAVTVVATSPSVDEAGTFVAANALDAVIVIGERGDREAICSPLLAAQSDLAIVYADMAASRIQVITSQSFLARTEELIEAIAFLPRRSEAGADSARPNALAADLKEGGAMGS